MHEDPAQNYIKLTYLEDIFKKVSLRQLLEDVTDHRAKFIEPDGSCMVSEVSAFVHVARNFGIDLENYALEREEMKVYNVSEVTKELDKSIISVKASVLQIYDTKTYTKKWDGREGKYTTIKLGDINDDNKATYLKFWEKDKHELQKYMEVKQSYVFENVKVNVYNEYVNLNFQRNSRVQPLPKIEQTSISG